MSRRSGKRTAQQGALNPEQQKRLIEFRRKKKDLAALLPAMWRESTDERGKLNTAVLVEKVARKIRDGGIVNEYDLARSLVDTTDRAMRPPMQKDAQGVFSFYNVDSYIPIAPKERREMPKATKEDIAAWQAIEKAEFEPSRVAYETKTAWRFDLLKTWRDGEKTLADVMARLDREKAKGDDAAA
jgi:hypothetical protein